MLNLTSVVIINSGISFVIEQILPMFKERRGLQHSAHIGNFLSCEFSAENTVGKKRSRVQSRWLLQRLHLSKYYPFDTLHPSLSAAAYRNAELRLIRAME